MLPLCSSCSAPAVSVALTSEMVCIPQTDHYDPVCTSDGESYTASDCTKYYSGGWDNLGIISNAFGSLPYLVVEKFVWCGLVDTVMDVMVYRLDENCYLNAAGNASHKLTLGRKLTITTYADANCMNAASEVTADRSTIPSKGCSAGDMKFLLFNAIPVFSVLAVYEDSTCSGTPSQLIFAPAIGCHDSPAIANAPCKNIGNSLFALSSCTQDYSAFGASVFGTGNPYVIEEASSQSGCGKIGLVTMYPPDDTCHNKPHSVYSFRATMDTDDTLFLTMFTDLDCTGKDGTTTLSRDELMLPTCSMEECFFLDYLCSLENCDWWWGCSRKLSIGGINIGANAIKSAVMVFNESSCANDPVQIIAKNQLTCSPQTPTCTELSIGSNGMYQDRACIGDVAAFAESRFTSSPYLIIEKYKDGTYCGKEKETVVYKADGTCYYSYIDGVSVRILPSFGNSVTIIKYQTTPCSDSDAEIVAIGSTYVNTRKNTP
ncbi:hypothetical protein PF005_g12317 [Phytophthora fragariae]|uniref:Uncharacterized protein n=1 Tax=Phytophthora fragariae TaxID=53985 RepID=A0A6A3XTS1_9STRA|nr:hypothetical protein PF003_g8931 [Phytophthora fragariae]KAE9007341.1 hypothetical protein PF011_g11169 [Phytophthora fragariae]KAE9143591.1 hypothetical protein PF006_g11401 [Phytophthora fragariae]KAE9208176.1 hypothetical protein PF005_g12317 [Phytophthora fragariae]